MEGRIISNNIVNINILLLLLDNEIMVFFILELIGKVIFIFASYALGLKRPIHRVFGV